MPVLSPDLTTQPADRFESREAFRASLVDDLRRQLFGPCSADRDEAKRELLRVSPLQLYATGVLFPQRLVQELLEDSAETEKQTDGEDIGGDLSDIEMRDAKGSSRKGLDETSSSEREPLNLANEFSPSACGISFRLAGSAALTAKISYGVYNVVKDTEPHPKAGQIGMDGQPIPATRETTAYRRTHHEYQRDIPLGDRIGALDPIIINVDDPHLKLHVTTRRRLDGSRIVSAMVVNHRSVSGSALPSNDDAYFQVGVDIRAPDGAPVFLPIDRDTGTGTDDEELASMELLYRHRRAFALGHGVAGDWNRSERLSEAGHTDLVCSAALPTYDLKPIRPREKGFKTPDLKLSMKFYSGPQKAGRSDAEICAALEEVAADYAAWIQDLESGVDSLSADLRQAAERNLGNCRTCHRRMREGINVLRADADAMIAFRLMNEAMLVQQFHSSLTVRGLGSPRPEAPPGYENLPDGKGNWRPFQIAFILMNIAGMTDPAHSDRRLVDLIWFPTGGGKTEAYLGLAAFTICLARLNGSAPGVTVLMRYTLRLLTAQQFQRAAALILALEALRRDKAGDASLGEAEISIGLWVGQSLSPNKRADAKAALDKLKQNRYESNPFQVLQCPWCGLEFTNREKLGYVSAHTGRSTERTVRFVCPDSECRFGAPSGLPIQVIDEDIYESPPTLLIGTVDKFAQIAWDDRVGRLFGIGTAAPPPSLIIQDELHLISGPLGTVVGLYEAAIDRMCARDGHVHKIVASTATIRRAAEQTKSLYARQAFEFPPEAIRAGDSYFAFEDSNSPGRLYVGFMGTAVKSHQTALVRACAPLLQSVCVSAGESDDKRAIVDPYGTMVWYFNSLRELGHAATLCVGDIPEFLMGLRHRLNIPFEDRRFIREIVELTSRRNADEIPAILQQLEIAWQAQPKGPPPVDILLATNMIAVGVDVSRLGLLVMSGQPKGTSEYIQATSRVGRRYPGLVVTVYTQTKSRDRSHYERFIAYHQSLYRHVEPTSVTPFSPQARERGLRGVLIALARQLTGVTTPDLLPEHEEEVNQEVDFVLQRIDHIDPDERAEAEEEIDEWLAFWKRYSPPEYGRMGGSVSNPTLAFPFGSVPDQLFQRDAWPLLTSMRNVDGTCEARVLNVYDVPESEPREN